MIGIILTKQYFTPNSFSYSIVILGLLCFSCSGVQDSSKNEEMDKMGQKDSLIEVVEIDHKENEIDKAMNAFTEIQVNGDGRMMLYLTFPNIDHRECYGEVSTFEISREEFHDALLDIMSKNNHRITDLERSKLAAVASLPSALYKVTTCGSTTELSESNSGETPPRKGTWIIPAIFGRSDLLINW